MILERSLILAAALLLDWLVGDPPWLWRRLPHPVVVIGRLIAGLERRLNGPERTPRVRLARGFATVLLAVGLAAAVGWAIGARTRSVDWGAAIEVVLVAILLAQRDLFDHVRRVRRGLDQGLAEGRAAVSRIVGRDPESLDAHGVARAAIESLAENFSDGVVAPAFWYLVAGPAGILGYKALNTCDSMIGHRSERYWMFGKAAARLDDLANLVSARLAGLLIAVAAVAVPGGRPVAAVGAMVRDAHKHRSVNAGWPEAAMAGALDLALAGPRRYGPEVVNDPWIGSGRARATAGDIGRALALFVVACLLLLIGALGAALAIGGAPLALPSD